MQTSEECGSLGWGFTTRHDAGSCRKRATALGGESPPLPTTMRTVAIAVDEDSLLDMIRAHASIKAGVGGGGRGAQSLIWDLGTIKECGHC